MSPTDAPSAPADVPDPLTGAARYIVGDVAIVRVPEPIARALGVDDGARLLWTSDGPSTVRVSVSPDDVEWRAESILDTAPEGSFPVPTTTVVRYVAGGVAVAQIPSEFAAELNLVDTARLRWALVADRVAQVMLDPDDAERVRAIRHDEDARMIEGIGRMLGSIPDYPTTDD